MKENVNQLLFVFYFLILLLLLPRNIVYHQKIQSMQFTQSVKRKKFCNAKISTIREGEISPAFPLLVEFVIDCLNGQKNDRYGSLMVEKMVISSSPRTFLPKQQKETQITCRTFLLCI